MEYIMKTSLFLPVTKSQARLGPKWEEKGFGLVASDSESKLQAPALYACLWTYTRTT